MLLHWPVFEVISEQTLARRPAAQHATGHFLADGKIVNIY
jgi:hypothetical protein